MDDYTTETFLAYNRFDSLPNLSYEIVKYLFGNENLMKMLYYLDRDCLSKPSLTEEQKRSMIYNGESDSDDFRIYLMSNLDDAISKQTVQLRIYPCPIDPMDRIKSKVAICIEVINHVKLVMLDDYTQRYERMFVEIMKSLNGADNIEGIVSPLVFDRNANSQCRSEFAYFNNKNYQGRRIYMSTMVSDLDSQIR